MNNVTVSIIIPTLREKDFLPHLLEDLKKQVDKSFEVLVVDAQSNDGTHEIVDAFRKYLKIRFIEIREHNVSYQRNFGSRHTESDFCVFLDADTRVSSGFIKKIKKYIVERKGLLFLPYILPDENYTQLKIIFRLINFLVEMSQNFAKPFSLGGSMIVERKFFTIVGGFNEKVYLGEDHQFIRDAQKWGVRAKLLHNVRLKYSLRRMKQEGQLQFYYKNLIATLHILFKGNIKNKIFDYQMGGGHYDWIALKQYKKGQLLQHAIAQIREFFQREL